jgi:putative N-acetylmannosamine-6-phosphate epimerase
MARIGVENTLSEVKEALQRNGHDVVSLDASNASQCDCCVISGQDKDMMGMADIVTQASVINAQGMTSDQVLHAVSQRVNK